MSVTNVTRALKPYPRYSTGELVKRFEQAIAEATEADSIARQSAYALGAGNDHQKKWKETASHHRELAALLRDEIIARLNQAGPA